MARVDEQDRAFLGTVAVLFMTSAAATIYLCKSMAGGMPMPGGWTMSMVWMRMGNQSWFAAASSFVGMWMVMMLAMMLPSLMPMLLRLRNSLCTASAGVGRLTLIAAAAYFLVWAVLGLVVYALGAAAAVAAMRWPGFLRLVPQATGVALLLAGVFQFTPWKFRRLARCRETADCERIEAHAWDTWQHGLRSGVDCGLCCAGLMTALLVTGVMSLSTMVIIATAITAERVARHPEWIARATGAVIIMLGILAMAGR